MDKKRIAIIAIIVGIIVFLLKVLAYLLSNSVALLSDALESIINIVASLMMFMALMIASRPEDVDHKYGHQKAENISALIEGVLIIIAAVVIVEASISRLLSPVPLENIGLGLIVSLGATSLNGGLAIVMMREARKNRSMALEGDAKHLFSDVISSVGVVIALFVATLTNLFILDAVIAIVVAALLARMGVSVLRKTLHDLMDSTCEEEEEIIEEILDRHSGYLEYHDLKTRRSGHNVFMEVHMCLEGGITVSEGNRIILTIEDDLINAIPGIVPNIRIEDETHCIKYREEGSE
jgi:cation diffusion facilitator family transporter